MKTYKHILVPLDSSELAEAALDDAFSLAALNNAQLTLLHVIPPIQSVLAAETGHPIFIDQQWDSHKSLAMRYLGKICARWECPPDVTINRVVEMGQPADTIIEYAQEHGADIIVMATHGRSGVQRWVYGSVADKVLRAANMPVLLVRSQAQDTPRLKKQEEKIFEPA
ncbi:MAG: universal stress protein [Chloroflexi bacterium]|nr:MAG: universal stress protein [Chloroflexota bacterium]